MDQSAKIVKTQAKRRNRRQKRVKKTDTVAKPDKFKQNAIKKYRKETGSKGLDPAIAPELPITAKQIIPNMTDVLPYVAEASDAFFNEFIVGLVVALTSRGYGTRVTQESYPYYLANYLKVLFYQVMTQMTLSTTRAPRWLHILTQMLSPVTVPVRTGHMQYSWNVSNYQQSVPPILTYSTTTFNFGVPGPLASGTFAFGSINPPAAYTADLGALAYTEMLNFCSGDLAGVALNKIEDISEEMPVWKRDISVFSAHYSDFSGALGAGGQAITIYNVKKVTCPVAAVFTYSADDANYLETELRSFATTSRFFANRLQSAQNENMLRSKFRPIFKPIDVNDIFDLLSTIIGRAVEKATQAQALANLELVCPLSGAEVFILLRELVSAGSCVSLASDFFVTGFTPMQYHVSQGSVWQAVNTMLIPTVLVENLRDLNLLSIDVKAAKGEKFANQAMLWVPVFGTYQQYRTIYDYDVTYFSSLTGPLYNQTPNNASAFRQSDLLLTEEQTGYILPNGNNLASAIQLWNSWVSQFTSCVQLDSYSSQKAETALGFLVNSRYVSPVVAQSAQEEQVRKQVAIVKRRERVGSKTSLVSVEVPSYRSRMKVTRVIPVVGTTDYNEIGLSGNQPLTPPYYDFYQNMVLPKYVMFDANLDILTGKANQVVTFEPYYVPSSRSKIDLEDYANISLNQRWSALADLVTVPGIGLDALPWTETLNDLRKRGHGGWLGSMLGDAAAAITGVPMLSALGNLIPI